MFVGQDSFCGMETFVCGDWILLLFLVSSLVGLDWIGWMGLSWHNIMLMEYVRLSYGNGFIIHLTSVELP